MAPVRARSDIVVVVPRHNAQRPSAALVDALTTVVRTEKPRAKIDSRAGHTRQSRRPRSESSGGESDALKQAIESASEWNSLLLIARAERGPQFDVATQQYAAYPFGCKVHADVLLDS
jgi:hypothetical protein